MATVDLRGKKFVKTTPVEVIDATEHQVMLQDVDKTHDTYIVSREDFNNDYKLGEDILEYFAEVGTEKDVAASNEDNTKGVK